MNAPGVKGLFFESVPYRQRPTHVFAWLGLPETPAGRLAPGMVLVHGGGGSAIAEWVRLWNRRGYAAIALDTTGHFPTGDHARWSGHSLLRVPHELGGPNGWGGFDQIDQCPEDQWPYHAVAGVVLAHSLLRAQKGVDPSRIGLTGVSWGGYLTCIAAGVDARFAFAAPVYGCGFLGENSCWLGEFEKMGPDRAAKWLSLWDPSVHVRHARMPLLWAHGTNDFAYPLDSVQKTYRLPPGPRTLSTRIRLVHGHAGPGEYLPEVRCFADSLFGQEPPLVRVISAGREGDTAQATFESALPIDHAEINFTRCRGRWFDRYWESLPVKVEGNKIHAPIPDGAAAWFFNIYDSRQLAVSSEMA